MKKIFLWLIRYVGSMPRTVLYLLVSLVPKRKTIWLFSAWKGDRFLDHPKYIYLYLLAQKIGRIRPYWITKNKGLYYELKSRGYPVAYTKSFRGIWLQMIAGVVIYTHSVEWEFCASLIGIGVKRVLTWHGIPIKKIGYDDDRIKNLRTKMRILSLVAPQWSDRCDLLFASSETDQVIYQHAFNVKSDGVRIIGSPRSDVLFNCVGNDRSSGMKIIYCPTFRGEAYSEFRLLEDTNFEFKKWDNMLVQINAELHIKPHPVQYFSQQTLDRINATSKIKAIVGDRDIYEYLEGYSVLITDFSGIYFDFLIMGKPIIMAPLLMQDYQKKDRALYYNYDEICPDSPCMNWNDILNQVVEVVEHTSLTQRYKFLQSKFHKYIDGNASERAVKEILSICNLS